MSHLGSVIDCDGQRYRVFAQALPSGWWAVPHPFGGAPVRMLVRAWSWRRAPEFR